MENNGRCKVCVVGGSGYIGSALVNLLLQKGYTVHATLRNLGDESKVGRLKSFQWAEERLHLFEADLCKPEMFEESIKGCVFVFLVAAPLSHMTAHKYNDTIEASINGVRNIADSCIRSGTVKRLIYTASIVAASPLKDDGSGYKNIVDESCWTPFHLNVPYTNDFWKDYTNAKTRTEQELLKIGKEKANELDVVTLCCGLVGGGVITNDSASTLVFISQITNDVLRYQGVRFIEELQGKLPIIHIEDVCRAHIFCAETPSVNGRFLCAGSYVSSTEIAKYYQKTYPQLNHEYMEELGREIKWGSSKLEDKGFAYKYDTEMILDDCLESARRSGHI